MSGIAQTPQPPYYAVIFTSERTDGDHGYAEMAEEMVKLASRVAEKNCKTTAFPWGDHSVSGIPAKLQELKPYQRIECKNRRK
ncbi:hypothetical protein J27TS7_51870 [Paenibacillus dendritiformis]|nr:hypothetical protein J27TS7_51870 [Paenibacillus dendritiformis]